MVGDEMRWEIALVESRCMYLVFATTSYSSIVSTPPTTVGRNEKRPSYLTWVHVSFHVLPLIATVCLRNRNKTM